jgi:hypothetical protein
MKSCETITRPGKVMREFRGLRGEMYINDGNADIGMDIGPPQWASADFQFRVGPKKPAQRVQCSAERPETPIRYLCVERGEGVTGASKGLSAARSGLRTKASSSLTSGGSGRLLRAGFDSRLIKG